MDKLKVALSIALLVLLIYLTRTYPIHATSSNNIATSNTTSNNTIATDSIDFSKMSDGEKLEYVIRLYFTGKAETSADEKTAAENKYIKSLPRTSNCTDSFSECDAWARNGECSINPEFMMYNCKKSCKSCSMNPEQLYKFTQIYNSRDSDSCVYHGGPYPDITLEYIRKHAQYNL